MQCAHNLLIEVYSHVKFSCEYVLVSVCGRAFQAFRQRIGEKITRLTCVCGGFAQA